MRKNQLVPMSEILPEQEYLSFLHWFQETYHELYTSYWKNIDRPADCYGVTVNYNNINAKTHNMLVQIIWQYINLKIKIVFRLLFAQMSLLFF